MADARLLAIPPSRSQVCRLQSNWDRVWRLASVRTVAALCPYHCSTCVALGIGAMMTWTSSPPSSHLAAAVCPKSPDITRWQLDMGLRSLGLNPTSHDTSWRQPCSTAAYSTECVSPFRSLLYAFQPQVRFLAYHRIKPHVYRLCGPLAIPLSFTFGRTPRWFYLSLSLRHSPQRANSKKHRFRAWTTRVSNPVCSPRFRASASIKGPAGCLRNRCSMTYLCISPLRHIPPTLTLIPVLPVSIANCGFQLILLTNHLRNPLNPVIPDNACTSVLPRGCWHELAGAYSDGTLKPRQVRVLFPSKRSLQRWAQSSFTRHVGWIRLPPIVQYSYC